MLGRRWVRCRWRAAWRGRSPVCRRSPAPRMFALRCEALRCTPGALAPRAPGEGRSPGRRTASRRGRRRSGRVPQAPRGSGPGSSWRQLLPSRGVSRRFFGGLEHDVTPAVARPGLVPERLRCRDRRLVGAREYEHATATGCLQRSGYGDQKAVRAIAVLDEIGAGYIRCTLRDRLAIDHDRDLHPLERSRRVPAPTQHMSIRNPLQTTLISAHRHTGGVSWKLHDA